MHELHCRSCQRAFLPDDMGASGPMWEQINAEGPWSVLGDGATMEDHIIAQLGPEVGIACPHCGAIAELDEENLGRLSLQLLGQW